MRSASPLGFFDDSEEEDESRGSDENSGGAKNGFSLFECFSLCLSRACRGKMIVSIYKWLKNAGLRR